MHRHFRCIDTLAAAINCQQQHTCSIGVYICVGLVPMPTCRWNAAYLQGGYLNWDACCSLVRFRGSTVAIGAFVWGYTIKSGVCPNWGYLHRPWPWLHFQSCMRVYYRIGGVQDWGCLPPPIVSDCEIGGVHIIGGVQTPPILSNYEIGGHVQNWLPPPNSVQLRNWGRLHTPNPVVYPQLTKLGVWYRIGGLGYTPN